MQNVCSAMTFSMIFSPPEIYQDLTLSPSLLYSGWVECPMDVMGHHFFVSNTNTKGGNSE